LRESFAEGAGDPQPCHTAMSPPSEPTDPFGFETPEPVYSPQPIVIIARPGQEIRIIVTDDSGVPGQVPSSLSIPDAPKSSPPRTPDRSNWA
jgi:hypothetical protein